jgi:hypothetical protein
MSQPTSALLETLLRQLSAEDPSDGVPEYLAQIAALTVLQREVVHRLDACGRAAIRAGATYSAVAKAAGVTKQRAHQRFRLPD